MSSQSPREPSRTGSTGPITATDRQPLIASFDYDAELRHYHTRLMDTVDIEPHARVLDVGCGTGQTTRAAARAASCGDALGVDISAPMLSRARHLSDLEGIPNVRFDAGDVQVHPLAPQHFTVGISRFGTMFFADPVAAFANIAEALRPGARFLQLVWQDSSRQEWNAVIRGAMGLTPGAPPDLPGSGAFSLADPGKVHAVLTAAGFADVQLVELNEPVYYGPDSATALSAIRSLCMTAAMLGEMNDASSVHAVNRLRLTLEARNNHDGVWFDSCAWLVTACRA